MKLWRRVRVAGLILGILVLIAVGYFLAVRLRDDSSLARLSRALEQEMAKVQKDQVRRRGLVGAEDTDAAWKHYGRAFETFEAVEAAFYDEDPDLADSAGDALDSWRGAGAPIPEAGESLLKRLEPAFTELVRGAQAVSCGRPLDLNDGIIDGPEMNSSDAWVMHFAGYVAGRSPIEVARLLRSGDRDRALRLLLAQMQVGLDMDRTCGSTGCMFGLGVVCHSALRTLCQMIAGGHLTQAEEKRVRGWLFERSGELEYVWLVADIDYLSWQATIRQLATGDLPIDRFLGIRRNRWYQRLVRRVPSRGSILNDWERFRGLYRSERAGAVSGDLLRAEALFQTEASAQRASVFGSAAEGMSIRLGRIHHFRMKFEEWLGAIEIVALVRDHVVMEGRLPDSIRAVLANGVSDALHGKTWAMRREDATDEWSLFLEDEHDPEDEPLVRLPWTR